MHKNSMVSCEDCEIGRSAGIGLDLRLLRLLLANDSAAFLGNGNIEWSERPKKTLESGIPCISYTWRDVQQNMLKLEVTTDFSSGKIVFSVFEAARHREK
jgi:hypothetical protein